MKLNMTRPTTRDAAQQSRRPAGIRGISAEQVASIERELNSAHGYIHLQCDDYRVSVQVSLLKTRTYVLFVYVDEWIRGEWLRDDCEQRRRFMCAKSMALYSAKRRAEIIKAFGKRAAAKHFPRLNDRHTYWLPYWTSARSMLRHFCANNQKVTVLSIGEPLPKEDRKTNEEAHEDGSDHHRAGSGAPSVTVQEGTDEVVAKIYLGGASVLQIAPGIAVPKDSQTEGGSPRESL